MARIITGTRFAIRDLEDCLSFNGVDKLVNFGHDASLNITGNKFSLGLWIKWSDMGSWTSLINKAWKFTLKTGANTKKLYYTLETENGQVSVQTSDLTLEKWHLVIITYDGDLGSNNLKIYVDNVLEKEASKTGNLIDTINNNFYIEQGLKGSIAEMFIGAKTMTLAEIKSYYYDGIFPSGMTSRWKMDEAIGTDLDDSIGGNDGVITNEEWKKDGPFKLRSLAANRIAVRDFGHCLLGDGDNDQVIIDKNNLSVWDGEVSLSWWQLLPEFPDSNKPIIDNQWGNDSAGGFQILLKATKTMEYFIGNASGRDNDGSIDITKYLGKWVNFLLTKKGTNMRLYAGMNGVYELLKERTNCSYGATTPTENLHFLSSLAGHPYLKCYLDEVAIFNKELSLAEGQNIFFHNKLANSLIHHWKFDEGSGSDLVDVIGSANGVITGATYNENVAFKPRTVI